MAFAEDLSVFFDVDEFAVTAILEDGGTVPLIFDRAFIEGNVPGIAGTEPVALARSVDVAAHHLQAGSTLQIPSWGQAAWGSQEWWSNSGFIVRGVEPDGTGLTVLQLEAP